MASFSLPTEFALVGAVGAATYWVNLFNAGVVSKHRKLSGIKYPNFMADKATAEANPAAHKFNCAQRAHANFLEGLPTFLFGLIYSGLYYPRVASALGLIELIGRIFYTRGYLSGNPVKRARGIALLHPIGYYGLMMFTTYLVGSQVYDLIK